MRNDPIKQMTERNAQQENRKKGGKILPALLSAVGSLLIIGIVVLLIPMTVPKLFGYEVFHVLSGSMEPTIPTGSLIIVKPVEPETVEEGDVIAFSSNGSVVTHRVVGIDSSRGEFITKGDANEVADIYPTPFLALIGKVVFYITWVGVAAAYISTMQGKICCLLLLLSGLLLIEVAKRLREN